MRTMTDKENNYHDIERQWRREAELKLRQEEVARRLRLLSTPPLYQGLTLSSFEIYDSKQPEAFKTLSEYIQNFSIIAHQPRHCFINGPVGTGKTMAAYIAAENVIKQGFSARYFTFEDLITNIRSTWGKSGLDQDEHIKSFAKFDLLIIDEFGRFKISDQDHKDFSKIIDVRYDHKKPNMIISNLFLESKSSDKPTIASLLGERLFDRFQQGNPIHMEFNWSSYRIR